MRSHCPPCGKREQGVTLLEVLVTIIIVTIGLLGLAGLQVRIQAAEIESYQRVQALVLLQDMVDRLSANRKQAVSYVTSGVGTGGSIDDCTAYTAAADIYRRDLCEWNNALLGASENIGTCTSADKSGCVGAMAGGRGCISNPVTTMPYEFIVSVAWQGLTPTAVPTASTCGQDQYGTNDAHRRVVTQRVVFTCLQSMADGVTCATATP